MGEPTEKPQAVRDEDAKRIKREALGIGDRRKHHARKAPSKFPRSSQSPRY